MIITAAFRVPPSLVGELSVYVLPARARHELDAIGRSWRRNADEHARAPHASLAVALSAVTGQPVRILPRTKWSDGEVFLITTRPIDPTVLSRAVRVWERLARGELTAEDTNALAPLIDGIAPQPWPLGEAIKRPAAGRVVAEDWVFKVLGWEVARQLAAQPVNFDHVSVPFRIDTDGTMVAWDTPILRVGRNRTGRALVKIRPHIKTLPGVGDLVCVLEASLTRLEDDFYDVRNVWIDHGRASGGNALLRLPVFRLRDKETGGWKTLPRDFSVPIVSACGLNPLPWGQDALALHPDLVRAGRASNNDRHLIGAGVGPRTYRRLIEHVQDTIGAEPLTYQPTGTRVLSYSKIDGARLTPQAMDRAVDAAGLADIRIVHLSATTASRERVRLEMDRYRDRREADISPVLGISQKLSDRVSFVAYDVADLLGHGKFDRSQLLERAPLLKPQKQTLVLALADTTYAGKRIPDDAKPAMRYHLAQLGIPSQFLVASRGTDDAQEAGPAQPASPDGDGSATERRDFPVEAAVKDLLMRCGGFTDGRLAAATSGAAHGLNRDAWLVGVHVRRQNAPSRRSARTRPRLVTTLVAVHARQDAETPWDVQFHRPDLGWVRHPDGLAAFHAGTLGLEINDEQEAYDKVRRQVDSALSELRQLAHHPIVVMSDADATRRIWRGLTNPDLRAAALPGDGLPHAEDIAVVRINSNDQEVPRPAHRTGGQQPRNDPAQPATPGSQAYEHEGDDGTRSWLIGNTSRTFNSGSRGRVGAVFTRFTLPETKAALHGDPWTSFTGTEITIARNGLLDEDTLLALTARLCAQPISWDGRTRWPVPLHMACKADEDHPQYRGHEPDQEPSTY